MDAAKNAVKGILGNHGHHKTDVHESSSPAVTNERVTRTNEERATTAVDKEVHQDHYHTTVQPVQDQAAKAEQHHHRVAATEERRFDHDNTKDVKNKLAQEQAQFRDTTHTVDGGSTTKAAPTAVGEHVHHVSHMFLTES